MRRAAQLLLLCILGGGQLCAEWVPELPPLFQQHLSLTEPKFSLAAQADLSCRFPWDYLFFSKDHYHVGFKLGREEDLFFEQGHLFKFLKPSTPPPRLNPSDPSAFPTVTFGFRFDF